MNRVTGTGSVRTAELSLQTPVQETTAPAPELRVPELPNVDPRVFVPGAAANANAAPVTLERSLHSTLDPPVVRAFRRALAEPASNYDAFAALDRAALDQLARMPDKNSPDMRALLKFWVEESNHNSGAAFAGHPDLSDAIRAKLQRAGFDIPPAAYGRPTNAEIPELIIRNSGRAPPNVREVRGLFAGSEISEQKFRENILPTLWRIPKTSSGQNRELVRIYGDPSVKLSPGAAKQLGELLVKSGYDVPVDRRPSAAEAENSIRRAVHETEPTFDRLSRAVGRGDATINVGVIDAGFDTRHPALRGRLATNRGETAGNNRDDDRNGIIDDVHGANVRTRTGELYENTVAPAHGTNVTGIATMGTDRVHAVPVIVGSGNIREQVDYAVNRGARVINMSYNYERPENMRELRAAIDAHPNVLFTLSARNEGANIAEVRPELLENYRRADNLVVVAAADQSGNRVPGSNWGSQVTLAAQTGILAPHEAGMYSRGTLTSMATPHVANVAAKAMLLDPALTPGQVRSLLTSTVDRSREWSGRVESNGVLNDERMLNAAAMTALIRRGNSAEDAANILGFSGDERGRLIAIVNGSAVR